MKFLIGFLVTIGLLIVVFILIFRGAANNDETVTETPMVDYANTSTIVQFTQKGPVTADQTHDELRITVSNVETAAEIFRGYQSNLVATQTFRNNPSAYADFLRALDLAGFDEGDDSEELRDDRGVCPTGSRFIMTIKDGDKEIQRYWASDCKGTQSFQGKTETVMRLFRAQVPDYGKFVSSVDDVKL